MSWFIRSRIPLYAFACVSAASFAPCVSNSTGISRFRGSGSGLLAPCLARRSLSSFLMVPLWPFVHWKIVLADRIRSRCAAFLKRFTFFIPIQPSFSQFSRCVVRPLMMYSESVMIFRGWHGSVAFAAAIIAASSPIWFDCVSPRILMAQFFGFLSPNHTPLPHLAFSFPLFRHALSV